MVNAESVMHNSILRALEVEGVGVRRGETEKGLAALWPRRHKVQRRLSLLEPQ